MPQPGLPFDAKVIYRSKAKPAPRAADVRRAAIPLQAGLCGAERKRDGVLPVHRLKARVKCAGSL